MKNVLRAPTDKMLEKLRKCREINLENDPNKHCTEQDLSGSLAGLYKRGFVNTRMVNINGKQLLTVYVTEKGVAFLNNKENKMEL